MQQGRCEPCWFALKGQTIVDVKRIWPTLPLSHLNSNGFQIGALLITIYPYCGLKDSSKCKRLLWRILDKQIPLPPPLPPPKKNPNKTTKTKQVCQKKNKNDSNDFLLWIEAAAANKTAHLSTMTLVGIEHKPPTSLTTALQIQRLKTQISRAAPKPRVIFLTLAICPPVLHVMHT